MKPLYSFVAAFFPLIPAAPAGIEQHVLGEPDSSQHGIQSLLDMTIADVNILFQAGLLTSLALVQAYLDRIEEVNQILRPVGELSDHVLDIARELDEERAAGKSRGPLHGIPILLKDNIATGDGLNNTAGSVCMLGLPPPRDATVVAKLRAAGAIIIGKTNLEEWAGARYSDTRVNGWSGYGGQVVGAYAKYHDPLGSSSGSGVAVSIGLAMAALGTETMGSIILPSAQNNIVGIKPTLGLTSRELIIPITTRQDVVGPMAKTVTDAAIILSAMAGKDPADNYTSTQPFESAPDYTKALSTRALKGARIGIPRNGIYDLVKNDTRNWKYELAAFNASIQVMKNAGAIIVDGANFPGFNSSYDDIAPYVSGNNSFVFKMDFKAGLEHYLSQVSLKKSGPHTLKDIYDCTRSNPLEDFPSHNTAAWDDIMKANYTNEDLIVWNAYQNDLYMGGPAGVLGALDKYKLDALILPSFSSVILPALAGLPIVTVPAGVQPADADQAWANNTSVLRGPNSPFGIAFMGRAYSEETLIGLAYAFEQRTLVRRRVVPWLAPETELRVRLLA